MTRVCVIRFSSLGDVLLTAPLIRGVLEDDPGLALYFLTKKKFSGYFSGIDRLNIIPADTEGIHKGLPGLKRLFKEAGKTASPDIIIDLHGSLRSRILCMLFFLKGKKVFRINKGRKEKKAYLKGGERVVLKHTAERYREVFEKAGISAGLVNYPFNQYKTKARNDEGNLKKIGIAPFAKHPAKSWPFDYTIELIRILSAKIDAGFFFYGSREDDARLQKIDFTGMEVKSYAGKLNPQEEIKSISELDIFISMDSANMHLADLTGIPVISIWGGTHPDLGFRPLNQPGNNVLQTGENLACRPCSVYGKKPCKLKEFKYLCLTSISPASVADKIISSI